MSTVAKVIVAILAVLGAIVALGMVVGLFRWAIVILVVAGIGYGAVKIFGSKSKAPAIGDRDLHKRLKQLETDTTRLTKPRK